METAWPDLLFPNYYSVINDDNNHNFNMQSYSELCIEKKILSELENRYSGIVARATDENKRNELFRKILVDCNWVIYQAP